VLADRLGATNIAAVDPSEPFAASCRSRVPGADVRVAVAEELPFGADEFDAVLAQRVVQLMDDRDKGVREMTRVTRPGAEAHRLLGRPNGPLTLTARAWWVRGFAPAA
jgi:ubiquinone/menaquinone biosynthesis C-methylase UbiE